MFPISEYIRHASVEQFDGLEPWEITSALSARLENQINQLGGDFVVQNGVAVHKTATVEEGAVLKPPIVVHSNCFVGAHAYLRGGVLLMSGVTIGPSVEIKSSLFFPESSAAHFNFVGDSIVGARVNIEAGAIFANHHNDRADKTISIMLDEQLFPTKVQKFGALVGDDASIGANAVLNPGTILKPRTVVDRLAHINQELA